MPRKTSQCGPAVSCRVGGHRRRRRSRRSRRRSCRRPTGDAAAQRDRRPGRRRARRSRVGASAGGVAGGEVGERVRGDAGEVRRDGSRARRATHSSIRSSSSRPASLAQVLDRARRARARRPRRELGVSSVSRTTTRPSSWATAVPGRGVARISTSSGASVTPAERHRAVGVNSTSSARAAAMTAGIADAEPLADLRQQRLDPPLDQRRLVGDELDLLDVDLVGDERRAARASIASAAVRAARARPSRAAGGS